MVFIYQYVYYVEVGITMTAVPISGMKMTAVPISILYYLICLLAFSQSMYT